jgi:hypothetical protein
MLNCLYPNEIANQLLHNDEQLQAYFYELKQHQDTLAHLLATNTSSNFPSDLASIQHRIAQLSVDIEERKNVIKASFFNSYKTFTEQMTPLSQSHTQPYSRTTTPSSKSYESSFTAPPTENPRLSAQHAAPSGSSSVNSTVYPLSSADTSGKTCDRQKSVESSLTSSSGSSASNIRFQAEKAQNFNGKSSDEEEAGAGGDDQDEDDESDDTDSPSVNVFGAALHDFKHQYSAYQSSLPSNSTSAYNYNRPAATASTASIYDDQHLLHKFNYVSLLLDDYCDKNTSLNTKALAHKYLKDQKQHSTESSYQESQPFTAKPLQTAYQSRKYEQSEVFTSYYIPSTSTTSSIMLDSTKFETPFQYYTEAVNSSAYNNNNTLIETNSKSGGETLPPPRMLKSASSLSGLVVNGQQGQQVSGFSQRLNSFGSNHNFPGYQTNSCNSSTQLTGGQFNMQQKQPTSTPRFSSYESKHLNQQQGKILSRSVSELFRHTQDSLNLDWFILIYSFKV